MAGLVVMPAGFVPQGAMAFGSEGGTAVGIDAGHPLPVAPTRLAAASTALTGTLSASGTVGPFVPELDRAIWVTLGGSWTGTASVLRSIDGGVTRLPLTLAGQAWAAFAGNAQEPIGEESAAGATYWLAASITSGALGYRIAQ